MSGPKGHGMTIAFGLGEPSRSKMTEAHDDEGYDDGHVTEEEKGAAEDLKSALDGGDGETIALALKHFWDLCEKEEPDEKEEGEESSKEY